MKKEKNIKDWDIKEKVKLIAETIEQNDDESGFNYFEELIPFYFSEDSDMPVIKEKMDNLIKLLEKVNSQGEEAFEKFENLDFENEIWKMI